MFGVLLPLRDQSRSFSPSKLEVAGFSPREWISIQTDQNALMALALALVVAACGGEGRAPATPPTPVVPVDGTLMVRAFEWGFEPQAIALRQGEEIRIVLENEGSTLHNLKVDDIDVEIGESRSTGPLSGDEGELFVGAEAGQHGTLTLVPREAGTFTFYCSIRGHRELGMEGTLIIE